MAAPHYHSHVDDPHAVGRRLLDARLAAGLSQRQLAFPGCSAAYISRLEAGERVPSLQLLRKLAVKLNADEHYLATGVAGARARPTELVEAEIALRLDDLDRAESLFERVVETASDPRVRAEGLAGRGRVAFRRGDARAAVTAIEQALGAEPETALAMPAAVETLGRAYAALGETDSSVVTLERALAQARERKDAVAAGRFAVVLADAYLAGGRVAQAQALLDDALADETATAESAARARLLWSQSRRHSVNGYHEGAARYARRTLGLLELDEDREYLARAQQLLGLIELERGNPEEALEVLRTGRALLSETADPVLVAQFRLEEARALAALGRHEEAKTEAEEVANVIDGSQPYPAGRSYARLGGIFADLGERTRAIELYERAARTLEKTSDSHLTEVYERLGHLLEEEGRRDEAFELLKRALAARQQASVTS